MDDRAQEGLRKRQALYAAAILVVYAGVYLALGGLRFDISKDERFFWPVVLHFSGLGWPSLGQLSDYRAITTPLPFLLFGWLEGAFGAGIHAARLLNLLISSAMIFAVGLPRAGRGWAPPLAAAGLVAFPYYLGTSVLLYTDILASALVLVGVGAYLRDAHFASALGFVLAIACRQSMVAFPAAIFVWELLRRSEHRGASPLVAQGAAVGSLFLWFLLFEGLAPRQGIAAFEPDTARVMLVRPQHALYFLATVGFYFVIPEALLFWRDSGSRLRRPFRRSQFPAVLTLLIVLFVLFPPFANIQQLPTMGFLDRGAHLVLPDVPRVVFFFALALLACIRFSDISLSLALVLANAVVVTKAQIAWDKYALPLLVVLWFMAARGPSGSQSIDARRERPSDAVS